MSETKLVYKCLDDPTHSFWGSNNMDGITCPICQFQVISTRYYDPEHDRLPYYGDLKKQCTVSNTPEKKLRDIEVTVELNTDKLQQQLRVIAKHAYSLADELDMIDAGM